MALQLTNILRDIREDRLAGPRSTCPPRTSRRFGVHPGHRRARAIHRPAGRWLAELIRFEADRARGWYDEGLRLLPLLDRRSAACTAAMAGIYRRLLDRIAADPADALDQPAVAARRGRRRWSAARALAGAAR